MNHLYCRLFEHDGYDRPTAYRKHEIIVTQECDSNYHAYVKGHKVIWSRKGGDAAVLVDLLVTLRSFGFSDQLEDYIVTRLNRRPTERTNPCDGYGGFGKTAQND